MIALYGTFTQKRYNNLQIKGDVNLKMGQNVENSEYTL